jgi:hypothetical protein
MEQERDSRAALRGRNRFIAPASTDGENDFPSRNIRKSISLTMRQTRRMI